MTVTIADYDLRLDLFQAARNTGHTNPLESYAYAYLTFLLYKVAC
jgi:hypothetical protein